MLANLESDPPEKVNIVKKRITKAEYQDDRDDLGFLSHYIIDMACQDKLQRIEANEKTREKELLERTCTYTTSLCSSECICGMSISDIKGVPKVKNLKKISKKSPLCGFESR